MPKTSDWVIIATEGNTIDGRKITAQWINDMAELYRKDEYTALVWPEHYRSALTSFEGKNWGVVEELKAEKVGDALRLFAKITANQYLLDANRDGQKLFTSIEPDPDYKGEGRCYLTGLAVTDSPASTGTTQLKFSRGATDEVTLECSALEELDLSSCFTRTERFLSVCKAFFSEEEHDKTHTTEDEPPMNKEQLSQMMNAIHEIGTKQGELEEQFKHFSTQSKTEPETDKTEPTTPETGAQGAGITAEQFSQLTEKLDGIATKQAELATQFNQLKQEKPDQRPEETGASNTMEVF